MVGTLIRRPLPPVSDFIRTLLDDANATTALATLGITTSTWTPTLTNLANLDATTAFGAVYVRVADRVVCFGQVQADATAAASTATSFGMSLPVASNFSLQTQLAGTATSAQNISVRILADATNDRAQFDWASLVTTNVTFSFIFGYGVI